MVSNFPIIAYAVVMTLAVNVGTAHLILVTEVAYKMEVSIQLVAAFLRKISAG